MHVRILDLDGGLTAQQAVARRADAIYRLQEWGPRVRMACSFGRFRRFRQTLAEHLGGDQDAAPALTLVGSGDFHHVSLALLERVAEPFNLLVLDNHPDWMRRIPFMHCGTWLYHAARLPLVRRIFHVGGDVDFDNRYQWLAPWPLLRSGKITVFPAVRRYARGSWLRVPHEPVRPAREAPLMLERMEQLLDPHSDDLARYPLYISLDKDVMVSADAPVNWDSGHLREAEVNTVLESFEQAAGGRLAGMDVVGDWSPVRVAGSFRRFFHLTEHPALNVFPALANRSNEGLNLRLLAGRASARSGRLIVREDTRAQRIPFESFPT
jgi:hypothetical protein